MSCDNFSSLIGIANKQQSSPNNIAVAPITSPILVHLILEWNEDVIIDSNELPKMKDSAASGNRFNGIIITLDCSALTGKDLEVLTA